MRDHYVEVLVKRNIEKEKKIRKILLIAIVAVLLFVGIMTSISKIFYLLVLAAFGYYFLLKKYCVEYEYFYMDGELSVARIINQSRRKTVMEVTEGMIQLIAPEETDELQRFQNLKKIDYSANEPSNPPYVMICEHKGELKAVYLQMNKQLRQELHRTMPYKIK